MWGEVTRGHFQARTGLSHSAGVAWTFTCDVARLSVTSGTGVCTGLARHSSDLGHLIVNDKMWASVLTKNILQASENNNFRFFFFSLFKTLVPSDWA